MTFSTQGRKNYDRIFGKKDTSNNTSCPRKRLKNKTAKAKTVTKKAADINVSQTDSSVT
jgi:hypothetical protein